MRRASLFVTAGSFSILAGLAGWAGLGCATGPATADPTRVVASLTRTECDGDCPTYTITIFEDGTVEYRGARNVKVLGRQVGTLQTAEMTALFAAFERVEYDDLEDEYGDCVGAPKYITSFVFGARRKVVTHNFCAHPTQDAPKSRTLTDLEDRIDALCKTERWTGLRWTDGRPTPVAPAAAPEPVAEPVAVPMPAPASVPAPPPGPTP